MINQTLTRMLELDALLEPLEDTFESLAESDRTRYHKLKNLMVSAEIEYYQQKHQTQSPWTLLRQIADEVQQAKVTQPKEIINVPAETVPRTYEGISAIMGMALAYGFPPAWLQENIAQD